LVLTCSTGMVMTTWLLLLYVPIWWFKWKTIIVNRNMENHRGKLCNHKINGSIN
jgi:hypothetical protein